MKSRLDLLASVGQGVTESEAFRLALQQSVAELNGLGGTVHLRGPMSALRLVSSAGLPPHLILPWEIIDQEGPSAPARALRGDGVGVWVSTERDGLWPGSGIAAVPVSGAGRAIGALSIVMGEQGPPTDREWAFLRAVVGWAEERMGQAPRPGRVGAPGEESGERLLRHALRAVQVGTWDWDIKSGKLVWDDAALDIYGMTAADFQGRIENWLEVVHPDDLPWTLAAAQRAIRDRTVFEAEYRVRRPGGRYVWTQARGRVVLDDRSEPVRMIGRAWDSNEAPTARDVVARALRHMSDGFLALDEEWRITFVNLSAEQTLGSSQAQLVGTVLWELPSVLGVPDLEARCREAAATGRPAGFDVRMSVAGGEPDWEPAHGEMKARVKVRSYHLRLVPVPDGVTLYFTDVTELRRREAEQVAAERSSAERAARIAELTSALAGATTSRDVVDAVARRVLPPFGAAGLMVLAVESGSGRLSYVGSVGYRRDFVDAITGSTPDRGGPVWDAILTAEPVFLPSVDAFMARYPAMRERPAEGAKKSWAFLPLTASGHTFGICLLAFDKPRPFPDGDRTLLTAISALVAHALERARLYDAEHTRSRELQRALLPRTLPDLPACTAAARYLPAGQGMDVGGDWYDVIPLSSGQVALVIGDVMGHGLSEAATMGRVRTAVHTLAALELPPDEIMGHLNEIVSGLGEDSFVTCLYALYDSTTRICSFARAGHPPPAVVQPDGTVHFPSPTPNPPLGASEPPFETVELTVPEEGLLVLYTDGLVEAKGREIDEGMAALAKLLHTADTSPTADLDLLCDTLTTGLVPADQPTPDDTALLVVRVHALAPDHMASWSLSSLPQAAGDARKLVREQLTAWGLDDLVMTTELLVSELVGNVVRHAKGPVRMRLLRSAELVCEVSDGSLTTPRIRRASVTDEGGRGLQLVSALSQRWGTRYTATGKCIWTEQALSETGTDRAGQRHGGGRSGPGTSPASAEAKSPAH
ncbi:MULTISPECIES: SpoIIE family protein phosphatase [Streptomyces]|uniref:protein-serine/threonine phosphatase n=1 Tax=Streptomyces doudnae TaxID=3075536 RepID=A0ABD5EVM0_9ACTN|nr:MULTISPECIES: SpoIIE family protein phosphatase [unclassified Streptomyces]MDT0438666.1 SpoIIE family protein phosphatase [Streptomyces sp. DSM 41981]MYQ62030.1 SpoIIE family protein phosphatase [Streptomyces sp. SID4950]SCD28812.1 PAS domain S-box-containing protein [Streptomyces sp. SolWspMP-5a-2]